MKPERPTGDPTQRFSDRVADYARARPSYPPELLDVLREWCGLDPSWVVADVGSGTGHLTRLFLDAGNRVEAVEPNAEMREAAERAFAGNPRFSSAPGRAEATGLPAGSVDLVAAAQSFHWFERERALAEFRRILRGGKWVALIWNDRVEQARGLMRGYEDLLLRHGKDYTHVRRLWPADDEIERIFGGRSPRKLVLPHAQVLDRAGLHARIRSSSYVPAPGTEGHAEIAAAIDALFDLHESGGFVTLRYAARVYAGTL